MTPRAKLIPSFSKDLPEYRERTYAIELYGGLGDVFNHFYGAPCYSGLEGLAENERIFVLNSSHNSCVWELFAWHRKANQITVASPGFFVHFQDPAWRASMGLHPELGQGCAHRWPMGPVAYYPPEDELPILRNVTGRGPYIAFAATASDTARSLPREHVLDAAARCLSHGFRVVLTGRNYGFHEAHNGLEIRRRETRLDIPGIEDVIDRLTIPGTAKVIERAAGVVTCHSAICMLAWHLKRPTFSIVDEGARKMYFDDSKFEGYAFGANRPGNAWASFESHDGASVDRWLAGIPKP